MQILKEINKNGLGDFENLRTQRRCAIANSGLRKVCAKAIGQGAPGSGVTHSRWPAGLSDPLETGTPTVPHVCFHLRRTESKMGSLLLRATKKEEK